MAVAGENYSTWLAKLLQAYNAGHYGHTIIGRIRVEVGEVSPVPPFLVIEPFDQACRCARVTTFLELVAQTGFVREDVYKGRLVFLVLGYFLRGRQFDSRGLGSLVTPKSIFASQVNSSNNQLDQASA